MYNDLKLSEDARLSWLQEKTIKCLAAAVLTSLRATVKPNLPDKELVKVDEIKDANCFGLLAYSTKNILSALQNRNLSYKYLPTYIYPSTSPLKWSWSKGSYIPTSV